MKKILLASTALIASAGVAAAEVTVNGDGYFGVGYGTVESKDADGTTIYDGGAFTRSTVGSDSGTIDDSDWGFIYDLDFQFVGTGESDSGLVFGAVIDVDDAAKAQGARGFDGEIFVSGDFGTLSMGDIDGGAENVIGDLAGVGLSGLGDFNENIFLLGAGDPSCDNVGDVDGDGFEDFSCGQGPIARYDYEFSGAVLSIGLNDQEGFNIGVGYDGGFWDVGLAYEQVPEGTSITLFDADAFDLGDLPGTDLTDSFTSTDDVEHIIGQVGLDLAGVNLKAVYGQADLDEPGVDTLDQYGISAGYSFDAFSVTAYYRRVDLDATSGLTDAENEFYGLGVGYDLGGGLALEAGIAQANFESIGEAGAGQAEEELLLADFGLSFRF